MVDNVKLLWYNNRVIKGCDLPQKEERQMKLFGSLDNRLAEGRTYGKIEVGTGVTEMCYSDRHAYEVVEVIDEKHILIRRCKATRIDNNGMSDSQSYKYEVEPYEEKIITEELLSNKSVMAMIEIFQPKTYAKIMSGKIGDKYGDNNIKLVLTKTGWKARSTEGKLSTNLYTVGIKEEYFDYSF